MNWINFNEQKPKHNQWIVVYIPSYAEQDNGFAIIKFDAEYDTHEVDKCCGWNIENKDIVYWMELPVNLTKNERY